MKAAIVENKLAVNGTQQLVLTGAGAELLERGPFFSKRFFPDDKGQITKEIGDLVLGQAAVIKGVDGIHGVKQRREQFIAAIATCGIFEQTEHVLIAVAEVFEQAGIGVIGRQRKALFVNGAERYYAKLLLPFCKVGEASWGQVG